MSVLLRNSSRALWLLACARHYHASRIAELTGLSRDDAREFARWLRTDPSAQAACEQEGDLEDADSQVTRTQESDDVEEIASKGTSIRTLGELLDAAEVDLDTWEVESWTANAWNGQRAGGEPVQLHQVKARLRRRPQWAKNEGVSAVTPIPRLHLPPEDAKFDVTLVVPDAQLGHSRDFRTGELHPLHDRAAMDAVIGAAYRIEPDHIVLLGDMIDAAPWGRHGTTPDLDYTTQPALLELHYWLQQLRLAAPPARVHYISGNHEYRVQKALNEQLKEAVNLRPANEPEGHDLLSIERLLGLDDLDIEYVGPYEASLWLHGVRFTHGNKVKQLGGQTAAEYLRNVSYPIVYGHVHRAEYATKTLDGPDGVREVFAMSPGTVAKTDGSVPHGANPGIDTMNWSSALGVLRHHRGTGEVFPELLPIRQGRVLYAGDLIEGHPRVEELEEATGYNFSGWKC